MNRNVKAGVGAFAVLALVAVTMWTLRDRDPQARPTVAATPSASPSPAPDEIACQVEQLALPAGKWRNSWATAVSASGRYVLGDASESYDGGVKLLWDNGIPRVVNGLPVDAQYRGVNNRGEILAYQSSPDSRLTYWVWRDGKVTRISTEMHLWLANGEHREIADFTEPGWRSGYGKVIDGVVTVTQTGPGTPRVFKPTRWHTATGKLVSTEVRRVDLVADNDRVVLQRSTSAALAAGSAVIDLLGPVGDGYPLVKGISADGRLISGSWNDNVQDRSYAIQWRCGP